MAHTKLCENSSTPECKCDCEGKLHGRNPTSGVSETQDWRESSKMKDLDDRGKMERKVERAWNNASYSNRLFTIGPVTGVVKDRDEAQFASRSSWDELSPQTKQALLRTPDLSESSLKYGTKGR